MWLAYHDQAMSGSGTDVSAVPPMDNDSSIGLMW